MKGHRFYEILEAHKKGEDLSVFVPTNPAEADLLADLSGGTGGSTGGGEYPSFEWNNPESKVNFGQYVGNKSKVVIDLPKLAEFYAEYIDYNLAQDPVPTGSGSSSSNDFMVYLCRLSTFSSADPENDYIELSVGNGTVRINGNHVGDYESGETFGSLFNRLGTVEVANTSDSSGYRLPLGKEAQYVSCIIMGSSQYGGYIVFPSDYPIDFFWFE